MNNVGDLLRAEREKQKMSIKDVEKAISIRAHYLNAIEDGNFDVVPGEVFLKGFIRNYAEFLGLNSAEILEIYKQNRPNSPQIAITTPIPVVASKDMSDVEAVSKEIRAFANRPSIKKRQFPVKLVAAALIVVCLGGGIWVFSQDSGSSPKSDTNKTTATTHQTPPTVEAAKTTPEVQSKPVVVVGKFNEECWLVATVDGKSVYEGTPKNGETITWEAQQTVVLKFGNAGAADITYNGKEMGKAGKSGEVLTRVYSATSATITTSTPGYTSTSSSATPSPTSSSTTNSGLQQSVSVNNNSSTQSSSNSSTSETSNSSGNTSSTGSNQSASNNSSTSNNQTNSNNSNSSSTSTSTTTNSNKR